MCIRDSHCKGTARQDVCAAELSALEQHLAEPQIVHRGGHSTLAARSFAGGTVGSNIVNACGNSGCAIRPAFSFGTTKPESVMLRGSNRRSSRNFDSGLPDTASTT